MIPSEKLRQLIASSKDIPLSKFAWDEELKKKIFSIELDTDIEDDVKTLGEVYSMGYNIGHSGVTSRYLSRCYDDSLMHYGVLNMLIGTKAADTGSHAWIEMDGFLLDPTLMITIPVELKGELGYTTTSILNKDSSKMLSMYDRFTNEEHFFKKDPEAYMNSIFTTGESSVR